MVRVKEAQKTENEVLPPLEIPEYVEQDMVSGESEDDNDNDNIEIQEPVKKKAGRPRNPPKEKKPRGPRTEAQKEATRKMIAVKMEKANERKTLKQQQEEEHKKVLEEKVVKTAIKIKKRQLKKEKVIEEVVSDGEDDEPVEEIKKKVIKRNTRVVEEQPIDVKPKFNFI